MSVMKCFQLLGILIHLNSSPSIGTCFLKVIKHSYLLEMYQVCIPCLAEEEIESGKGAWTFLSIDVGKVLFLWTGLLPVKNNVTLCGSNIMHGV